MIDKELLECALKRYWKGSSVCSVISVATSPGATRYEAYLSTVTRLTVNVVLVNGRSAKRNLIMKVAQVHDRQGREFISNYDVFKIETMMYKTVLKEMEYLMDDFEDTDGVLWCNLVHHVPYSCLVLEDLKAFGFSLLDRNVFFDMDHSLLAVHSLGRYHGMCKVLEERGIISKDGFKQWFVFSDLEMHRLWFWNTNAFIQGVKKYWDPSWVPIVEKIKINVESLQDKMKKLGEVDETRFNVLNHGDCHKNNIMFKHGWQGRPVGVRFLDYQIPHYGSPCCDLTFMLYLAVDPFVRREHYDQLVEVFQASLLSTLNKFKFGGRKPDLNEIREDMEKFSFFGLYLVLFGFSGMFMSKNIDLFGDYEKLGADEGAENYNLDQYRSESFKKAVSPDLKTFVFKFFK